MKAFRKVFAVPDNFQSNLRLVPEDMMPIQQTGGNTEPNEVRRGNPIRQYAMDRQRKLLTVILQLAKNNSYTDDLAVQLTNGSVLEPNQFINLLNYALSPGKAMTGINDFVEVLHRAKVTPEMLINENVKLMLRNFYQKRGQAMYSTSSTQTDNRPPPPRPPPSQRGPSQGTQTNKTSFGTSQVNEQPSPQRQPENASAINDQPEDLSNYDTRGIPEPPDEDFDDESITDQPPPIPSVKRKRVDDIVEEDPVRRSSRVRQVPDRLQVGQGWEAYDSDDEI